MKQAQKIIETNCMAIGDGDNYRSTLLSNPKLTATGHTQTEATGKLVAELKKLGHYSEP